MTESLLVGFVRKSNAGNALKLNLDVSALNGAAKVAGKDGKEYISLIINLAKIKAIIADEHEVTSVCQLVDDYEDDKK